MSGTVTAKGVLTLGAINIALATTALPLVNDLLAMIDTLLGSAVSLGSLKSELGIQLNGVLQAMLSLKVTTPASYLANLLNQLAAIAASIKTALFTSPTVGVGAQLGSLSAVSAQIKGKIAALDGLLALLNTMRGLASSTYGTLFGKMSSGGFALYTMEGPATLVGNDVAATIAAGISGGTGPGSTVHGILILTEDPIAFATLSTVLKTS